MKRVLPFTLKKDAPAQPPFKGHVSYRIPFPCQKPEGEEAPQKAKTSKPKKVKTKKEKLITKVKIAQRQLGIPDEDYRVLLHMNFGVDTCKDLNEIGLVRLISHFRSKGWQDAPAKKPIDRHGKPKIMKDASHPLTPTLQRIEALLSEIGRAKNKYMPWGYAAAILQKNTGVDSLEAATVRELQNVMVALENTLRSALRKQA